MPICPRCGKLISSKKFARHLARCGKTHKKGPVPLRPAGDNYFMQL